MPIAINGSWKLVQYGKFPLSTGQKITWEVLEPFEAGNKTMEEIVEAAEKAIRKAL